MRELASLLLVVLLVYVFQCLCWAPPRAHAFSLDLTGKPGHRKRGFPWSALNLTGYWANPLPPLQPLVMVDWPEFQLSPEAFTLNRGEAEPLTAAWEQLALKPSGGKLLCNDVKVFQGGPDQVKELSDFLLRVKMAKPKKRGALVEGWLRKVTDAESAKGRVDLFRHKATWLHLLVNAQFFLLFMITPLAFARFGSRALWPLVGSVFSTSVMIAWLFWRLHKRFFPGDGDGRFKSVFSTVLSPIYAIRAGDALARDLLAGFHPVVAAGVLCPKKDFEAFAGEQLRANRFSQSGTSWYAERLQLALSRMVTKQGVQGNQLLQAPERQENCVVYCPRCRAQYTRKRESCSDCGYEELLAFADGAAMAGKRAVQ
jgi:hypothetical protein